MTTRFTVCAEVAWDFEDSDVNWTWCKDNATFLHKEACEFIIHIGEWDIQDSLPEFARGTIKDMKEAGCTADFIATYDKAARSGAVRVLFWY